MRICPSCFVFFFNRLPLEGMKTALGPTVLLRQASGSPEAAGRTHGRGQPGRRPPGIGRARGPAGCRPPPAVARPPGGKIPPAAPPRGSPPPPPAARAPLGGRG